MTITFWGAKDQQILVPNENRATWQWHARELDRTSRAKLLWDNSFAGKSQGPRQRRHALQVPLGFRVTPKCFGFRLPNKPGFPSVCLSG